MGAYARATPDAAATSSLISELGYQLALDPQGHLALYPFAQWVVRPNGTANQPTAVLAGISARLRF
jgi:carbohydrate-selective porin OprB